MAVMAVITFDYQYIISNAYDVGAATATSVSIDTGAQVVLSQGSQITLNSVQGFFLYAYQDGFVAHFAGADYFFTDQNPPPSTVPGTGGHYTVCFLAGTLIATPAGERPVETLAAGDLVLTADGRAAPVYWVGRQTVATLFADPLRTLPVRITAGALGGGLPTRDLFVSPDHALFLDDVLVQAGALVNGTTITRVDAMPERFTYFHVELEDHALILAEGVPAETFVDNVTRRRFDNFAEYEALFGDVSASIAEIVAPRIKSTRQLPRALRDRIAGRSAA